MDKPEMPKAPDSLEAPRPRERLIDARTKRKLSQRQVADRLGTTHINVSRWERGITKPNPFFRRRLVQLFGKTEEELDLVDMGNQAATSPSLPEQPPGSHTLPALPVPSIEASSTPTSSLEISSVPPTPAPISPLLDPTTPVLPPHPLVGREEELARLKQRLCSGKNATLTALNGLPGVGKTTLSIAIAHDPDVQAYFRDGILWAGLGPKPNMSGIISHWCTLLGISQAEVSELSGAENVENRESTAVALRRAIGSRRMLLVIDDAWRLDDALALRVGGPNCAHLITTRYPSIAHQLGPESAVPIRELDKDDGMQLLRILAPQAIEREAQKAQTLVQAVGGLPLALTLIGNFLRRHTYSGQPRRVEAALARLSDTTERLHISEPHGIVDRHPSLSRDIPVSLASVIAVTDDQLNEEQQAALRALAVFPPKPDSFSEEAALAVTGGKTDVLDSLVDTGLLEIGEANHYTMHQTIADYAHMQLDAASSAVFQERLINYIVILVNGYKKDYTRLEQESSAMFAALEAAYALGKSEALMRTIYGFIPYLRSRGLYNLAEKHLRRALEMAEQTADDYGKAGALLYLGEIAQKQGNYEQASAHLNEGLRLARQVGEPERITALLADLGWVTWKRGEYTKAEGYLNEGHDLARMIEDKAHICDILETLGSVAASRGSYMESMQYMEEALPIARQLEDSEKTCTLLINLGVTEGEKGNFGKAEEYFLEGLEIARRIGHREWESLLLSNLGEAESELGHYEQAEDYFLEGLALARKIDHREWSSALLSSLGLTMRKQGNYARAKVYLDESLELARLIKRPLAISNALYEYGILHLYESQIEAAYAHFQEMRNVAPDDDQELRALADYGLARVAAARGHFTEARYLGENSISVLESIGHRNSDEVRRWLTTIEI